MSQTRIGRAGLDYAESILFERTSPGRVCSSIPHDSNAEAIDQAALEALYGEDAQPADEPFNIPEISELELSRHYTRLSRWNHAIDLGAYPLGSCTMKYNPKINEWAARLDGFANLHPYLPESRLQGALSIMWDLQNWLSEVGGFVQTTMQPAAGAHGEMLGVMLMRAALEDRGQKRSKILVPESAHGTNPATAAFNGFEVVSLDAAEDGCLDVATVDRLMDEDTAGIMITNPNTLGMFERDIKKICDIVHERGGYVYGDGANMNAILGIARPGDLGIDVMHYNLHKTFTTPHGGGGPGCGAVGVSAALEPFLPTPLVKKDENDVYSFDYDRPKTVGRIRSFYGNFGMNVRAWTYIREMGAEGLKKLSQMAVLNANYARARLDGHFHLPFKTSVLHEVVFTDKIQEENGVSTMDIAKRLIDFGFHPPTVYFPLVVHGALMIEPTETEPKEAVDQLCDALIEIAQEAQEKPDHLKQAPHETAYARFDEAFAARCPILRFKEGMPEGGEEYKAWAKANAQR